MKKKDIRNKKSEDEKDNSDTILLPEDDSFPGSLRQPLDISAKRIALNTIINLVGQIAPLIVGLFAIPRLVRGLEFDRFGLLSLIWLVLGYFTFFDLGLGRVIIKLISEKLGSSHHKNKRKEMAESVTTTLCLMLILGVIGAIGLASMTHFLVTDVFQIPNMLEQESQDTFYLLALSLPFVVLTAGLRGVLEAEQRFVTVNLLHAFIGAFTYLGPLALLPYTHSIFWTVGVLVFGRMLVFVAYLWICLWNLPEIRLSFHLNWSLVGRLIKFGGWMTVSNILSPVMVYFDRFLLGSIVPVAQIGFYTTPYEMVTRVLVVPGALVRVLFPAFAATNSIDHYKNKNLFDRGVKATFLILFPISLILAFFAEDLLALWLGAQFAVNSAFVLQILAIGVLFNGIAWIPFTLLQSAERPDITAKIHIIEIPFYLALVWFLTTHFGIKGTAVAWSVRVILDTALMFFSVKFLESLKDFHLRSISYLIFFGVVLLIPCFMPLHLMQKVLGASVIGLIFIPWAWGFLLGLDDRIYILRLIRRFGSLSWVPPRPPLNQRICAVVVSYYPDQDFQRNLQDLAAQVEKVFIVDNGTFEIDEVKLNPCHLSNVESILLPENLGIAAALNRGVKQALKEGFGWVMTMDQDSRLCPQMTEKLLEAYQTYPYSDRVGIVSPCFRDENLKDHFHNMNHLQKTEPQTVQELITTMNSGCLVNARVFSDVGFFDESLFIDYVDHDFCLKLQTQGYRVIQATHAQLMHKLGHASGHWFIYRNFVTTNHNVVRRYYNSRNRMTLYFRYILIEPRWVLRDLFMFSKEILKILLAEKEKSAKLLEISRGIFHSFVGRLGRKY